MRMLLSMAKLITYGLTAQHNKDTIYGSLAKRNMSPSQRKDTNAILVETTNMGRVKKKSITA